MVNIFRGNFIVTALFAGHQRIVSLAIIVTTSLGLWTGIVAVVRTAL